jgi:hypothetical protein
VLGAHGQRDRHNHDIDAHGQRDHPHHALPLQGLIPKLHLKPSLMPIELYSFQLSFINKNPPQMGLFPFLFS